MPKKGDFVVAVAVFLLALLPLLFLWTPKGNTAVVRVDGEAALRIDLDRDGLYPVQTPYGENLLQVEEGRVFVAQADCPDGLCLNQGAIDRTGQSLACLPHRLSVTIEGEGGYDAIAK